MSAPAAPAPARRRHDLTSVVDVAVRVFAEKGYDGTSMEDLAKAAGLSKSSLYHHVESKDELLARGLDRAVGFMMRKADELAAPGVSSGENLRRVTRLVVELAIQDEPSLALMRRLPMMASSAPWAMERYYEFERIAADMVVTAVADGELRDDIEPLLLNRLMWLMVNAVADVHRLDPSIPPERLADIGLDVLMTGVGPR